MNFNKIKEIAKEKKINLSDIAIQLGMTREGFSGSLRDENLKVTALEKIAEILQVDITIFFRDEENSNSDKNEVNKQIADYIKELDYAHKLLYEKERVIQLLLKNMEKSNAESTM